MPQNPLHWIQDELVALEAAGMRRIRVFRRGRQAGLVDLDGKQLVNFSSNDYLGLAANDLNNAIRGVLETSGWGSGASPLVTGRGELHDQLERQLADFEGTEAALTFPSGYAANVGTITALVGKGDVVYSDAKNHASIIDGTRLCRARVRVYRHCDTQHLLQLLDLDRDARRRLIVTDGLFSMDGDLAPLGELAEIAERCGAMLMVDEAHATGVFGELGRGVSEFLGVESRVAIRIGTLSKALGSIGGFVAGPQSLIEWLANRARPYVYSTALPEACAAAAVEALRIVRGEPHRRTTLLANANGLRRRLVSQGWNVGASQSQIIPLIVGPADRTMQLAAALRKSGLLVPGIRPPSVPPGESLLRISLSFAHGDSELQRLVDFAGQ